MAEYGIKIKNANGFVVIDGNYSNLGLRQKGTIRTDQGQVQPGGMFYRELTISGGDTPMIALQCASSFCLVSRVVKSGSSWTYTISTTEAADVSYFIFDKAQFVSRYNTNYGLIVKNKNTGLVVFDSRAPYMRIIGVIQGSDPYTSIKTTSYATSKVAVIQCTRQIVRYNEAFPGSPPMTQVGASSSAIKTSGGSVSLGTSVLFMYPPATGNPIQVGGNDDFYYYLVLDVENF